MLPGNEILKAGSEGHNIEASAVNPPKCFRADLSLWNSWFEEVDAEHRIAFIGPAGYALDSKGSHFAIISIPLSVLPSGWLRPLAYASG